jgi:hypothetical protein
MTRHSALAFVASWLFASLAAGATLDEWVQQNTRGNEAVVCKKELNGEYFFIALDGSRIKAGNRLDVTGNSEPLNTAVAWVFQRPDGKSISSKAKPVSIESKYIRDGSRMFLESVEYHALKGNPSISVRASVVVRKCAAERCTVAKETIQEPKSTIRLCEFRMKD